MKKQENQQNQKATQLIKSNTLWSSLSEKEEEVIKAAGYGYPLSSRPGTGSDT